MQRTLQLTLSPETAFAPNTLEQHIYKLLRIDSPEEVFIRKTKQSIDARGSQIKVNIQCEVYQGETPPPVIAYRRDYPDVSGAPRAIVVGCGPAGMFAAIKLIEQGIKPIILERGKDVRSRRRDLAAINKDHIVNPDSNYCFGEGGAGTYSDGKLYTRSNKRGNLRRILEIFVAHGASEQILIEAHPHIGTNKLPHIVAEMRESILSAGGEIHFSTRVTDFIIAEQELKGVITADGLEYTGIGVLLATGHSARDIYELLNQKNIYLEPKSFAMGVRVEHPQSFIDKVQYHCAGDRGPYLPAASYSLVTQTYHKGIQRGVFSFCMCPGGFIVPAATAPGELVVNGMSPSRRDSRFANSGIVVAIQEEELKPFRKYGVLAGLQFQKELEQHAWRCAGSTQQAPAQRALDFSNKKRSGSLNETSYQPGLLSADFYEILPETISYPLQQGLRDFGRKVKGYLSNDAQLIGIESRTSSPVRIPRDADTCEHPFVKRLFPCAEGAGYAGGIMSAAMDGERCAEQLVRLYSKTHFD